MNTATVTSFSPDGIVDRVLFVHASVGGFEGALVVRGPDGSLDHELRDRVYAGIINSGLRFPRRRITVAMTPPGPRQPHVGADLAVVAAVLIATEQVPATPLHDVMVLGEVGLDGAVRPVPETLRAVAGAAEQGHRTAVVPADNARQAMLVPGMQIIAVRTVRDLVDWAFSGVRPPLPAGQRRAAVCEAVVPDLAQLPARLAAARFGLEVTAAGGHHLAVTASPGAPRLPLAQCLPSLLPDLDEQTAVQVSGLHAAAGRPVDALIRRPPLEVLHPSTSLANVIGGRRPGAVTLAHHGVLLLEDAPEFDLPVLRTLRQPLDLGIVQVAQARRVITYPARFQLVATGRSCPCTTAHAGGELCPAGARRTYRSRWAAAVKHTDITVPLGNTAPDASTAGESSATVAARVMTARALAADRWAEQGYQVNGEVPLVRLQQRPFRLPPAITGGIRRLLDVGALSFSGYARIVRLAWTVGDLRGLDRPDREAVTVATDLHTSRLQ